MAEKRIYQIAKELNISHVEIIKFLKSKDIEVANHMAPVDNNIYDSILMEFSKEKASIDRQRKERARQAIVSNKEDVIEDKDDDSYFPPIHQWQQGERQIDKAQIAQEWLTIKNTMWNLGGLIRSQEKLHAAMNILRNLQSDVEKTYQQSKLDNEILSLRNGAQTALAIIASSIEARESKGTHYVED